tara:strand:+ start:1391 stop:1906 length:516 start_codon:yes stop_codon:yes gene_type:complete
MTTALASEILQTIHNLNRTDASFGAASSTITTSIPNTIGLYQLINQMISDLSSIKATIKTNEKKLSELLSAHSNSATTAYNVLNITLGGDTVSNDASLQTKEADINTARGTTGTLTNKPAIICGTDFQYSEDAIFYLFQHIQHQFVKLKSGLTATGAAGLAISATIDATAS